MGKLAIVAYLVLVFFLLKGSSRSLPGVSRATWIPLLWLIILSSRPVSLWFTSNAEALSGERIEDVTKLDRNVYLILEFAAFMVLLRRRVSLGEVIRQNPTLALFYAYLAISAFWSDDVLVALKRWIKDLGSVAMILILLTEVNPLNAVIALYRRCAHILVFLSVVFIKYVPDMGRAYAKSGDVMLTGVTLQKNSLGLLIFTTCTFLLLHFFMTRERKLRILDLVKNPDAWVAVVGAWLLQISQSKTSLICLSVASIAFFVPSVLRGMKGYLGLFGVAFVAAVLPFTDTIISFLGPVLKLLGRDATLTGRTDIWAAVFAQPINPLLGEGFLAFWDKPAGKAVFESLKLNSAHNGYIEVYLDGGLIGIGFLALLLLSVGISLLKTERNLLIDFRFSLLLSVMVYNLSEGSFARLGAVWFLTLLTLLRYQNGWSWATAPTPEEEEETETKSGWSKSTSYA